MSHLYGNARCLNQLVTSFLKLMNIRYRVHCKISFIAVSAGLTFAGNAFEVLDNSLAQQRREFFTVQILCNSIPLVDNVSGKWRVGVGEDSWKKGK